jgi:uncharacterized MAPEG superfamily protein
VFLMEPFAAYGHAIVSVALFALITLVIGPLSAMQKAKAGVAPGAAPAPDYGDPVYRAYRAHQNAVENAGLFTAVTLAAILAGSAPFWVNLFASIFLVARILHLVIHLRGIGSPDMGPRSFAYVAGWLMCILLGVMAVVAVF